MIDITNEKLLTLGEATRSIPEINGKHLHPTTLFRWIRYGVRGGIRLEHVRVGRRICTTEAALNRFMNATGENPEPAKMRPAQPAQRRTLKQRDAAIAAAMERLAAAGVLKGAL